MNPHETIVILNRPEKHFLGSFYFLNIKHGIDAALEGTPYQVLLTQQDTDIAASVTPGSSPAAGVIAIAPPFDHECLHLLAQTRTPSVVINSRPPALSWVDLDNARAAKVMTEHLINLGHERILYIGGFPDSQNSRDRFAGYTAALEKYHMGLNPGLVLHGDFSITLAYEKIKEFVRAEHPPFTAIAAGNDLMAVGAIRALIDEHIRVPEDVAVAGFDDFDFSSTFYVPLTTYRQPFHNIGFVAAKMLLRQITEGFNGDWQAEMMGEIVVRESCGSKKGK